MSEFSLIYTHFKNVTLAHSNTRLGIGDDCAVSDIPPNHQLVSCIDTLVAGQHFPLDTTPHAIGYKAVAVNLSDLSAMGAIPYAILLGLSLPKHLANDGFCGELARGMADCCNTFNVELIGGDTTQSDVLTLSVTALGFVPQGQAITRQGAKIGDVVCVSGEVGSAGYALQDFFQGKISPLQSALDYPIPQVKLGQSLIGYATAMIDISDGLGQDLGHILTASGVGARLDLDKIPMHNLLNELPNTQKWQHILNGGDDYQLCFTLSPDKLALFKQYFPELTIYPIGEIVVDKGLVLYDKNTPVDFEMKGWEHF